MYRTFLYSISFILLDTNVQTVSLLLFRAQEYCRGKQYWVINKQLPFNTQANTSVLAYKTACLCTLYNVHMR
jgi:hypothetical protein